MSQDKKYPHGPVLCLRNGVYDHKECLPCRMRDYCSPHWAEEEIQKIKDSGQRTHFSTGAVRDMHEGKGRYDLLPWAAINELALHCEQGAKKYGEHNVNKGIPIHSLIDSGIRHLSKYLQGMTDEPHLRAALWNIAWAMQMEVQHPEMQDIPTRGNEEHV